jgi:prepilin-type N-terminal cleavage/methylation domain-containing protein
MAGWLLRRSKLRLEDDGFTLIELLVVIIIIGILAAIAIPVYLNQRQRAYDAASKSDIRVLAEFEETYYVNSQVYADLPQLDADGEQLVPSKQDKLTIMWMSTSGYCLSAHNLQSSRTWYYDSQAGGIQPLNSAGCPMTTSGTAGSSRTG